MTLEQAFYILGIAYFSLSLLILLATLIATYLLYLKLASFLETASQTADHARQFTQFLSSNKTKTALSFFTVLSAIFAFLKRR